MKGIYKLSIDCGRMGEIEGVFVSTPDEVARITGKEIYFGEILGKHSEISEVMTVDNLKLISIDEEAIKLIEANGLMSGYNPFDYFDE